MLRKWSANRIVSLQVTKTQETWLREFCCLFFLSFLTSYFFLPFSVILLAVSLACIIYNLLHLTTSFHSKSFLHLSQFFLPSSHESLSFTLSFSETPPRYISLTLLLLQNTYHTLRCFPSLPTLYPYNCMCTYTHTHTHTERNICPCLIFSSTFPSAAHFEISLGVCSFIFSTERIRNSYVFSSLPSLFCLQQSTSFATTYRRKTAGNALY